VASITRSKKSNAQSYDLYTKQSLYRDTGTISIKVAASNEETRASVVASSQRNTLANRTSVRQENGDTKTLQKIIGCDDAGRVTRLGKALLRLYALEQS